MKYYNQVNLPEGVYVNEKNGKGIIVDSDNRYIIGSTKIKKDRYKYFQYRKEKKVIQVYVRRLRYGES